MKFRSLATFSFVYWFAASLPLYAKVDFNREIRPLMADTCFGCHGFDANTRKGKLRLDDRESALKVGRSGKPAIVPGKPEQSEIIKRIFATDEGEIMPPPEAHKTFTPAQKELFRQWVKEGADYPKHWAFTPPQKPALPKVNNTRWSQNAIDTFILQRLEKEGLAPSPQTSKETLIRRVSLDVTGIPPTLEQVQQFLNDKSLNAYEKVVDRLFASPHYGERMALQWLDYARYADSHGFQSDSSRTMWPWRDWVIQAFNENKPFDQFTVEQIAGDLLPQPTRDQILATAFNRNHRLNGEAGIVAEEWRIENIIDRVDTTGATWLGLTLGCARCHDHKYDPVSQREFYQLFAYYNNVPETGHIIGEENRKGGNTAPYLEVPTPEQETQLAKLQANVKTLEARLIEESKNLPTLVAAWEPTFQGKLKTQVSTWQQLAPSKVHSAGGAKFTKQADGSYLAGGKNPDTDIFTIEAPLPPGQFGGLLLEALPDASLTGGSLGRASNGNFVLSRIIAEIRAKNQDPQGIEFARAEADYSQKDYDVSYAIAVIQKQGKGWAIDGNMPDKRVPRKAMFLPEKPLQVPDAASLVISLRFDAFPQHSIGRFRFSTTTIEPALAKLDGVGAPENIKTILALAPEARNEKQQAELSAFYKSNFPNPIKKVEVELASAKKAVEDHHEQIPAVMVMQESDKPRPAFVLLRGEYDKLGEEVKPALPASFGNLPDGAPNNRLGLARWIVDPKNPLTARVWVNRQWEKYFGTGLVKTSENFGLQGEAPSHPELLDWLATEFVRLKWDMKALQKQIVMSAAYRQSSKVPPNLQQRDPENRLIARGPRFRLPAEVIRDQALSVSGLLAPKIGGPSVRPYMPENVWDETSVYGNLRGYKADKGEGLYRRTLYTIWKRTAAPPTLLLFDAPTRESCRIRRSTTNTPLQALSLLNEVTFVEAARVLAQKALQEGGTAPQERITYAFRRVTGRAPDVKELKVLSQGLQKRLIYFKANPEAAKKLLAVGDAKVDEKLEAAELAAYTLTANVLFNLDEAVTKE